MGQSGGQSGAIREGQLGRKGNRQNLFVGIYLLDLRDCVIVIMGIHGLFQWQALDCCTVSGAVQIPFYLENPQPPIQKAHRRGKWGGKGKGMVFIMWCHILIYLAEGISAFNVGLVLDDFPTCSFRLLPWHTCRCFGKCPNNDKTSLGAQAHARVSGRNF